MLYQPASNLLDSVTELHLIYAVIISVLLSISTRFKTWELLRYVFLWLILRAKGWPVTNYRELLLKTVALPFAALSGLWTLASLTSSGSPDPLPWLPLLNPLDIVVAFVGYLAPMPSQPSSSN